MAAGLLFAALFAACDAPSITAARGTVSDSEGRPLAGATVELRDAAADTLLVAVETAADGAFELQSDARGPLMLQFSSPAHRPRALPVAAYGASRLQLEVRLRAEQTEAGAPELGGAHTARPAMVEDEAVAGVRFADPQGRSARVARLYGRIKRASAGGEASNGDAAPADALPQPAVDTPEPREPLLRQLWLLDALAAAERGNGLDADKARVVAEALPPTWPLWSYFEEELPLIRHAFGRAANEEPDAERAYVAYLQQVVTNHPDPSVRAAGLFHAMRAAYLTGSGWEGDAYLQQLLNGFPRSRWADRARRSANPRSTVLPGLPVPDFALASLDSPGDTLTPERLRGRVYLIDFWATWCAPCIAEMDNLHDTYGRFHDRGFDILSVNMDTDPKTVVRFRAERWPMPWWHARLHWGDEQVRRFSVPGLPRTILVGRDGVVREARLGIMGDDLPWAVVQALEEGKEGPQ